MTGRGVVSNCTARRIAMRGAVIAAKVLAISRRASALCPYEHEAPFRVVALVGWPIGVVTLAIEDAGLDGDAHTVCHWNRELECADIDEMICRPAARGVDVCHSTQQREEAGAVTVQPRLPPNAGAGSEIVVSQPGAGPGRIDGAEDDPVAEEGGANPESVPTRPEPPARVEAGLHAHAPEALRRIVDVVVALIHRKLMADVAQRIGQGPAVQAAAPVQGVEAALRVDDQPNREDVEGRAILPGKRVAIGQIADEGAHAGHAVVDQSSCKAPAHAH